MSGTFARLIGRAVACLEVVAQCGTLAICDKLVTIDLVQFAWGRGVRRSCTLDGLTLNSAG
eukprot:5595394-Amphidinium_carterae.1